MVLNKKIMELNKNSKGSKIREGFKIEDLKATHASIIMELGAADKATHALSFMKSSSKEIGYLIARWRE